MSLKTVKCYECKVKKEGVDCNKSIINDIITLILQSNKIENSEKECSLKYIIKYDKVTKEENHTFFLEVIKDSDEGLLLFRIGKTKELEGMLKRNKVTLSGEGILDESEQQIYELEICTYILFDIKNCIFIEMYGQFAPGTKVLIDIFNKELRKLELFKNYIFEANHIMSDKIIESFKDTGNKLKRIGFTYSLPKAEKLGLLGLEAKQISELNKLGGLYVDCIIRNRPRIPLTKKKEKISSIIQSFGECSDEIRRSLFFEGSTGRNKNKKYSFEEEGVTYTIDISTYKFEDKVKIKYDLKEIEEQVYEKLKLVYNSNKQDILTYI